MSIITELDENVNSAGENLVMDNNELWATRHYDMDPQRGWKAAWKETEPSPSEQKNDLNLQ